VRSQLSRAEAFRSSASGACFSRQDGKGRIPAVGVTVARDASTSSEPLTAPAMLTTAATRSLPNAPGTSSTGKSTRGSGRGRDSPGGGSSPRRWSNAAHSGRRRTGSAAATTQKIPRNLARPSRAAGASIKRICCAGAVASQRWPGRPEQAPTRAVIATDAPARTRFMRIVPQPDRGRRQLWLVGYPKSNEQGRMTPAPRVVTIHEDAAAAPADACGWTRIPEGVPSG
jgi:hypothetical protein